MFLQFIGADEELDYTPWDQVRTSMLDRKKRKGVGQPEIQLWMQLKKIASYFSCPMY